VRSAIQLPRRHHPRTLSLRLLLSVFASISFIVMVVHYFRGHQSCFVCMSCGSRMTRSYDGLELWRILGTPTVEHEELELGKALRIAGVPSCCSEDFTAEDDHHWLPLDSLVYECSPSSVIEREYSNIEQCRFLVSHWDSACTKYVGFLVSGYPEQMGSFLVTLTHRRGDWALPYTRGPDSAWIAWIALYEASRNEVSVSAAYAWFEASREEVSAFGRGMPATDPPGLERRAARPR